MVSNAAADAVRAELGLGQSWWLALLHWWGDMARLNLGVSSVTGESVLLEVAAHLAYTMALAGASLFLACLIGLPLGIWSGLHVGGKVDRMTMLLAAVLRATPAFLLALVLMLLVAVQLGSLPVAGSDGISHVLLPALTLGLGLAAGLAKVTRESMRQVAASASYEFARTKGLTDRQALVRHGLRQAALPVVAYLGVHAVFLVEGTVVVETIFAWPGIGHELVHAVFGRDIPMIQGSALCMGLLFVAFNLVVDSVCLALDPRQRLEADRG